MKLSPLAEIKRDELAAEREKIISEGLHFTHGVTARQHVYLGFNFGYAFAQKEELARKEAALKYCEPHLDKMWAAVIVGNLLGCEFRDCKQALAEYRQGVKDE